MYNVYYFWNNFKNNLRTLSGWFLTKHPVNKNTISLNPEINVLAYEILYLRTGPLSGSGTVWFVREPETLPSPPPSVFRTVFDKVTTFEVKQNSVFNFF